MCAKEATVRIEIQTNYFRGDDEVQPRCDDHKDDPSWVTTTIRTKKPQGG